MRPFSKFFEQFCICNDASNSVEYIILQQRTCEYKLSTRWRETIRDTHTSADDDVTRESRVWLAASHSVNLKWQSNAVDGLSYIFVTVNSTDNALWWRMTQSASKFD